MRLQVPVPFRRGRYATEASFLGVFQGVVIGDFDRLHITQRLVIWSLRSCSFRQYLFGVRGLLAGALNKHEISDADNR